MKAFLINGTEGIAAENVSEALNALPELLDIDEIESIREIKGHELYKHIAIEVSEDNTPRVTDTIKNVIMGMEEGSSKFLFGLE